MHHGPPSTYCYLANHPFISFISVSLKGCETFIDIVIVLDGSNSIYPWYEVQDFLINILQKFYIRPGQTQVCSTLKRLVGSSRSGVRSRGVILTLFCSMVLKMESIRFAAAYLDCF